MGPGSTPGRRAGPVKPGHCPPSLPQEGEPDGSSPYIQVLEEDWRQALREQQEKANTILSLRKDLRQGEALRTRVRGCVGWGPPLSCSARLPPPSLRRRLGGGRGEGTGRRRHPRLVRKLRASGEPAGADRGPGRAVGASGWLP